MTPNLTEAHRIALAEAISSILDRYEPLAIVASGSIVRGAGHAGSDFDIVVVHEPNWRQRIQHVFLDVPCEIFVNPVAQIRRQMAQDAREGRPVMAHMLATGTVVHDTNGIGVTLQQEGRENLAAGPKIDAAALDYRRYGIATVFEDAVDLVTIDPERCRAMLVEALVSGLKWWSLANGRWLPRDKELFTNLDLHDPDLGSLLRSVLREPDAQRQAVRAAPVMQRLIGATGFYEWEGRPEPVEG